MFPLNLTIDADSGFPAVASRSSPSVDPAALSGTFCGPCTVLGVWAQSWREGTLGVPHQQGLLRVAMRVPVQATVAWQAAWRWGHMTHWGGLEEEEKEMGGGLCRTAPQGRGTDSQSCVAGEGQPQQVSVADGSQRDSREGTFIPRTLVSFLWLLFPALRCPLES